MSAIPDPGRQKYFIVGARPVRLVRCTDGGLAVEAVDWKTGEMVRATEYLTRITGDDVEVDEVSAETFERAVAEIRASLSVSSAATTMNPFEKAIAMAADAHAGQTDKAGEPYILHILRVVLELRDRTAQTVAALHDIVEDTPLTFEDLEAAGFASEIVEAVRALTKRADEAYDVYLARVAANPIARRVKIADLEDNMRLQRLSRVSDADLARLRKYHHSWKTLKAVDP